MNLDLVFLGQTDLKTKNSNVTNAASNISILSHCGCLKGQDYTKSAVDSRRGPRRSKASQNHLLRFWVLLDFQQLWHFLKCWFNAMVLSFKKYFSAETSKWTTLAGIVGFLSFMHDLLFLLLLHLYMSCISLHVLVSKGWNSTDRTEVGLAA